MISSKIIAEEAEIKIEHEDCSDPNWCRKKEIFIESMRTENNTLSTISFNDDVFVYVFWESFLVAKSFEVLYVADTGVLFFGCGNVTGRVCTRTSKLLGLDYVTLFWGLERHKNYVLEMGELECSLYFLDGEKVSKAEVDPPYEVEVQEEGIKFESIVMGTTWLRYE